MNADISSVLYSVIDEIGREKIRMDVSRDVTTSESYCELILNRCKTKLGEDGDAETMTSACEGLLHFMLTATLVPSQRKLVIQGAGLDIVIPSLRILMKSPKKSVVVQVIKNGAEIAKIANAEKFQPVRENIWLISSCKLATSYRRYDYDTDLRFAKIVRDMHAFVASKGGFGLRLLHGENQA